MKAGYGCKLFGAHQMLMGIKDCVVLFHSVVGCNFGTASFHVMACDMTDIRQTCTIISDSEIVFNGENALQRALCHVKELYTPKGIFVITGCVSDMIQDDVNTVCARFQKEHQLPVFAMEAAGYRGSFQDGFEAAGLKLLSIMEKQSVIPQSVNIIGFGADDWHFSSDRKALEELLRPVKTVTFFGDCTLDEIKKAPQAALNLVFGRGVQLAKKMHELYGTPYEILDYPYGLSGARELRTVLSKHFLISYLNWELEWKNKTAANFKKIYSFLQTMYGMPVSIIGTASRARGLSRFFQQELGLETEVLALRENTRNIEEFYEQVRISESAILFGSSFEQELADELGIPLFRFDYPVFDRICLSDRPYIGEKGEVCLIEDLFNELYQSRHLKGALYR